MSGHHQCAKTFLAGTNSLARMGGVKNEIFHSRERTTPVDPRRVMYQAYIAQVLHVRESLIFH